MIKLVKVYNEFPVLSSRRKVSPFCHPFVIFLSPVCPLRGLFERDIIIMRKEMRQAKGKAKKSASFLFCFQT
jgi:hypothetical protein